MGAPWGIYGIIGQPLENIGIQGVAIPFYSEDVETIAKALGFLGILASAGGRTMGNTRNHWKPLEIIGIQEVQFPMDCEGCQTIEKELVLLGILAGAGGSTVGNARNH